MIAGMLLLASWMMPQDRCEVQQVRELSTPASERLRVKSGPGPVEIGGDPDTSRFEVTAVLCASDQDWFDQLEVTLEDGELRTSYPDAGWSWGGDRYARIGLEVRVPPGTGAELEDGSGAATIHGVGSVVVKDGSGSLRIRNLSGALTVEDGSGSLWIESVQGDVSVKDGSGSVRIAEVTGSVRVSDDGSGSLVITGVGGDIWIGDPGSGRVEVRDVVGSLTVEEGRRGRISHSDVRGGVDLPERR